MKRWELIIGVLISPPEALLQANTVHEFRTELS